MIEGVHITPLRIIPGENGDVLHAIKVADPSFAGFGEAYFSTIDEGAVKAWKRHRKMILNLVVPVGEIKFVMFDDRQNSRTCGKFSEIILSRSNYQRLTIPPMIWMGFKGLGKGLNMLLNISNMPHDPDEVDRQDAFENHIGYDWEKEHT